MTRVLAITGAAVWTLIAWRYIADVCRYALARTNRFKENA